MSFKSRVLRPFGVSAAALICAMASAATAQTVEPGSDGADEQRGLTDIVVTAQRRSENLQDVPIAVTTLTADTLKNSGVNTTENLTFVTPGFVMNRQRRNAAPYIRGIGSQASGVGIEAPVSTYVDGVYFFAPSASLFSFNNIERVEVLKGPQGTLFGRNATGGLVNIITRDPQVEPMLKASLTYGNYDTFEGTAYATGGGGNLAIDLAAHTIRQGDGYGRLLLTGEDVLQQDSTDFRSKLVWSATEADTLTISGDWSRDNSNLGLNHNAVPGSRFTGGAGFVGSPFDSQANRVARFEQTQWGASVRFEHDFGEVTLSLLSAYRNLRSTNALDIDDGPLALATAFVPEESESFQNEILLSGATGPLTYTVGAFIFNSTSQYNPLEQRSPAIASVNLNLFGRIETRSYAGFAQGTYALGSRTNVTAGLRYTLDQRHFVGKSVAVAGNANPVGTIVVPANGVPRDEQADFPRLTWRFALDHELADDVMAYVSYNRGFKSGTFNPSNPGQPAVRPETLDAVEGGLKSELFGRTLRFNVSGFYYWYKDIQLAKFVGTVQQLLNAARAEMYGAEIDALYVEDAGPGEIQLSAGLSYLHGRYTSFPGGLVTSPLPGGGGVTVPGDLTGRTTIRSPEFTLSLGLQYTVPVGAGELGFNASYYHNDGFFWEPDNRLRQKAYNLVNAQIAYSFGSEKQFRVRVFGNNLTNDVYYGYAQSGAFGDKQTAERPRTYGVGLDFEF